MITLFYSCFWKSSYSYLDVLHVLLNVLCTFNLRPVSTGILVPTINVLRPYTFFYKQLFYKPLALSLNTLSAKSFFQNSLKSYWYSNFQKMTVWNTIHSDLHCWTKATKQSSRNFFEQSKKTNDMINQKILEKHKKNVYSATLLSNFEPWKPWKYKQLWGLGPNPSCL